jgi:hypothetical protein
LSRFCAAPPRAAFSPPQPASIPALPAATAPSPSRLRKARRFADAPGTDAPVTDAPGSDALGTDALGGVVTAGLLGYAVDAGDDVPLEFVWIADKQISRRSMPGQEIARAPPPWYGMMDDIRGRVGEGRG